MWRFSTLDKGPVFPAGKPRRFLLTFSAFSCTDVRMRLRPDSILRCSCRPASGSPCTSGGANLNGHFPLLSGCCILRCQYKSSCKGCNRVRRCLVCYMTGRLLVGYVQQAGVEVDALT